MLNIHRFINWLELEKWRLGFKIYGKGPEIIKFAIKSPAYTL